MEVVLLLIVAAGVVALIYISIKRKELDEPVPAPDKPVTDGTTTTTIKTPTVVEQPEEKEPSDPLQNTIYKFAARRGTRRCPFCDGENRAGDEVCKICGQDI